MLHKKKYYFCEIVLTKKIKVMRKFLLSLVAICFLALGAQAQEMSKGQLVGSARINFWPSVNVSADYGMWEHLINKNDAISVGAQVGVCPSSESITLLVAARGNFHYQFVDKLDTYAGLSLGYAWGGFGFGVQLGTRYYFNNKFAGNIEFGGFTGFALGVSMKL